MTHCRKFCFKAALLCAVVVKTEEKGGAILERDSNSFHSLSSSANDQEKQDD